MSDSAFFMTFLLFLIKDLTQNSKYRNPQQGNTNGKCILNLIHSHEYCCNNEINNGIS